MKQHYSSGQPKCVTRRWVAPCLSRQQIDSEGCVMEDTTPLAPMFEARLLHDDAKSVPQSNDTLSGKLLTRRFHFAPPFFLSQFCCRILELLRTVQGVWYLPRPRHNITPHPKKRRWVLLSLITTVTTYYRRETKIQRKSHLEHDGRNRRVDEKGRCDQHPDVPPLHHRHLPRLRNNGVPVPCTGDGGRWRTAAAAIVAAADDRVEASGAAALAGLRKTGPHCAAPVIRRSIMAREPMMRHTHIRARTNSRIRASIDHTHSTHAYLR